MSNGHAATWQFPPNEAGKVFGWSDDASPSNPDAALSLVNRSVSGGPVQFRTFSNVNEASGSNIPPLIDEVEILNYATEGDGGGARYIRVANEPSHGGKFQSANGAWWEIASNPIHVKMTGAKLDGATDDTTAFQRLFSACAALGADPDLGDGVAVISSGLQFPLNRTIRGGDITLNLTGASASVGVSAVGATPAVLPTLNSSPSKGSKTLEFSTAPDLAPNDIVCLRDPTDGSFNGVDPVGRSYYRAGEYCLVKEVSGTTVTLWEPLLAGYDHTVITTHKFPNDTIKLAVSRLTVLAGPGVTVGVSFRYLRDVTHDNLSVIGSAQTAISRTLCYNIRGSNIVARQSELSGTGTDYGLSDGSCHKTYAHGEFFGKRHGYVSGNGGGLTLPCRFMDIVGIFANDSPDVPTIGAANAHGNCEFYTFDGEFHGGGVNFGGDHGRARGDIFIEGVDKHAITGTECLGTSFDASGMRIFAPDSNPQATRGIVQFTSALTSATVRGGKINLSGVEVSAPSCTNRLVNVDNQGATPSDPIVVDLRGMIIHEADTGAEIRCTGTSGDYPAYLLLEGYLAIPTVGWSVATAVNVRGWRRAGAVNVTPSTSAAFIDAPITFSAPKAPIVTANLDGGFSMGGKLPIVTVSSRSTSGATLRLGTADAANFPNTTERTLAWQAMLDDA